MLKPGDVFLERYEIEEVLGEGGFASVYRARQSRLGRRVAIKMLRLDDEAARRRFELEAQLVSRLRDPATVTMHDFGEADGRYYMVLELVAGRTLREIIDTEGGLGPQRTVAILRQVVGALVEAHDHGILHRDIKPDNIMVFDHYDQADRIKVLDFGIAKLLASSGTTLTDLGPITMAGQIVGTPRYMAPEVLRGESFADAADIFSVGLVAYEMLLGERAVKSADPMKVIARLLDRNPIVIPPHSGVPPELAELVNRMLAKSEGDRIGTARELSQAIDSLPEQPAPTEVYHPADLARMRAQVAAASVDDDAATIADVVIAKPPTPRIGDSPALRPAPARSAPPLEPSTDDVDRALASLRADVAARKGDLPPGPPAVAEIVEATAAEEHEPIRGARVSRPAPSEVEPELAFTPKPRGRRLPAISARDVLGFGLLLLAVVFALGYFAGAVGVKATVRNGEPLDCGLGSLSVITERHFVAFGIELFELERHLRCSPI